MKGNTELSTYLIYFTSKYRNIIQLRTTCIYLKHAIRINTNAIVIFLILTFLILVVQLTFINIYKFNERLTFQ